jgi:hypothetical protein
LKEFHKRDIHNNINEIPDYKTWKQLKFIRIN